MRFAALLLVLFGAPLAAEDGARLQSIRLVTWNLEWFPGRTPAPKPDAVAAHIVEVRNALAEMKPDILVLQEVATEKAVEEAIASLPDFKVAVVSRFKTHTGQVDPQQIAICSRFPARFVTSATWEKGWAGPPRGYAFASLSCGPAFVNVYGLHLKSNLGDAQKNTSKREDAMEQLLKHHKATAAEQKEQAAWIICGDFNTDAINRAVPSEKTFPLLKTAGFFWTFEGLEFKDRITCPAKGVYPDASFDHVWTLGLGRPVAAPVTSQKGSDHLPVAVDLLVPPK